MADHDDAKQKQALIAAKGAVSPAVVKMWHQINRPNAAAAVNYLNATPAQQAGEAFASNRSDGTVDVYAFF